MTQTTAQQAAESEAGARPPWQVAAAQAARPAPPGLDWLAELQAAARTRMAAAGLPGTDDEDWRYTKLTGYTQRWAEYLSAPGATAVANAPTHPTHAPTATGSGAGIMVDVADGVLLYPPTGSATGLTISSLRQLPPGLRARTESLLSKTNKATPDKLVDLNTALLGDAILIATDPGCRLRDPVHVRLKGESPRAFGQPRLLVDIAPDSELTLILEYTGETGTLVNAVNQIRIGRGSHLNLIRVQTLPDDGMLLETTEVEVGEAAAAAITSVDLGGQLSRQGLNVLLAGAGADATVNGLFLADGRRHIDNHTRVEHQAPVTTSREYFRGIADGHGRGVFNGKIVVLPGAAGSTAALTNRNLLLTPTAEIDTKPELEIYVDDVRCSHGATTGQLDANALFYLRSRGLDPAVARQLLTSAFLLDGLNGITIPHLHERLAAQLQARLGNTSTVTTAGPAQ